VKLETCLAYIYQNDKIATLELDSPAFAQILETQQSLKNQQDKAMIASTFCQGNVNILNVVHKFYEKVSPTSVSSIDVPNRLLELRSQVEGYREGFQLLQTRIKNSMELVR